MAGVSSVGANAAPNQLVSQPQTAPPKAERKVAGAADSIVDVGDLPDEIIDVGDLPDGATGASFDESA